MPSFEVAETSQREGAWVVPVKIRNDGDVSVEAPEVTLEVRDAGGEVLESAPLTVGLLGQAASVDAEFWIDHDPDDHELRFDVTSYSVP